MNIICLIPLIYTCVASNYGIMNLKFFNNLHDHGMTSPGKLVFSAKLITHLAPGIAYNFFWLVDVKECAYYNVMAPLNSLEWLGPEFIEIWFPLTLFLAVIMTLLNGFGCIMNSLGVHKFDFDPDYA